MPLGYEVFAGNRRDVTTVEEIVETMENRYGKADRIWAMDRGMVSEDIREVMGDERKLYYREMIARFGHHLNCQWMVSEEMEHTPIADAKQWITRVHQLDPYNHPIGFHSRGTSITYTTRCSMIPILTMCARITTGPPLKMCMRKLKTWSRSPSTQTILGSFAVTSRDVAPT